MEQEKTVRPKPLLLDMADNLAEWFPEVNGRSIAVSEIEFIDDRSNLPTLPIIATALVTEQGQQSQTGGKITINDDVLIHFIFEPVKYTRADGGDTPFYAFYDYERIRDTLLEHMQNYRTPRGGSLAYRTMDVESDERAVYIAFRFMTEEKWCPTGPGPESGVLDISFCMYPPKSLECDCCEEKEIENPCPT